MIRFPRWARLVPVLLASVALAAPALADLYTWKDEKGVVHMTDRKEAAPSGNVTEIKDGAPRQGGGSRAERVQAMLAAARNNSRYVELQQILDEYRRNHSYSATDYFVCVDMALELANILKTRNFSPKVVAGNAKTDTAGLAPDKAMETYNHAWVVVELAPGVNVALEATAGFVVDEKVPNFEYYYQGLVFENPRQAKETNALIASSNDNCKKARELVQDWNARYAGRVVDQRSLEAKGRVDAKMAECTGARREYTELITKQYKKLY